MNIVNRDFDGDNGDIVKQIALVLDAAKRVAIFTGAGLSAESGLPTYRGIGGLYNEMTVDEGLPIEEILSGPMFASNPALTWKYLAQIERACRGAKANAAHMMIAAWEARFDICVITQNVDGFHRDVGSTSVIELHGNLHELVCTACGFSQSTRDFSMLSLPPKCHDCSQIVRPNVVLFGEALPAKAIHAYQAQLDQGFDALIAVGTSAGFPYISGPIIDAAQAGIPTIEINPDETVLSAVVGYRYPGKAVAGLSEINAAMTNIYH